MNRGLPARFLFQWIANGTIMGTGSNLPNFPELPRVRNGRKFAPGGVRHTQGHCCLTLGGTGRTISRTFQTAALAKASDPTSLDSDDRRGFKFRIRYG